MFKIDKGVPITPPGRGRPHTELSAAVRETVPLMQPGDSFFYAVDGTSSRSQKQASIGRLIIYLQQHTGLAGKFATRRVEGGVRVWRVE